MPYLIPEASLQVSRRLKMDLTFHLIAMHASPAAFEMNVAELVDHHWSEHFEPCGIRSHPFGSHLWDTPELHEKLEEVLEEAERHDYSWTVGTLPGSKAPKELHWVLPSCAETIEINIPRNGRH